MAFVDFTPNCLLNSWKKKFVSGVDMPVHVIKYRSRKQKSCARTSMVSPVKSRPQCSHVTFRRRHVYLTWSSTHMRDSCAAHRFGHVTVLYLHVSR